MKYQIFEHEHPSHILQGSEGLVLEYKTKIMTSQNMQHEVDLGSLYKILREQEIYKILHETTCDT